MLLRVTRSIQLFLLSDCCWHFIPGTPSVNSAIRFFGAPLVVLSPCSPLLKEKGGTVLFALFMNLGNPRFLNRSGPVATLTPNNCPVNVFQVHTTNRGNQWFERYKSYCCRHFAECVNAAVRFGILNAGPQPDVG